MNSIYAVQKLTALGYHFQVEGNDLRYEWHGSGKPDPSQVKPLFEVVKQHKNEVRTYLAALVTCRTCDHAEVGQGWAMCQAEPWDGIPGQAPDFQHPCPNFAAPKTTRPTRADTHLSRVPVVCAEPLDPLPRVARLVLLPHGAPAGR